VVGLYHWGTAVHTDDYTLFPDDFNRTISAGSTFVDVNINVVNDTVLEGTEHIVLWVAESSSYVIDQSPAAIAIFDNEVAPQVNVTSTGTGGDPNASEVGLNTGTFRISRTGSISSSLEVDFILPLGAGRAFLGGDYILLDPFDLELQSRVTISPNTSFVDVRVQPIADTRNEGTETVLLTLVPNAPTYTVGTASATISITDDPQDVISIPTAYSITEIAIQQGTYHQRHAYSINNNEMVVGDRNSGSYGSPQRGYKWVNGSTTDLGTLSPGGYAYAFAVNDSGVAVGYGNYYSSYDQPIRWDNSTPTFLYPAAWGNAAVAINANGYIVGSVKKSNGKYAAASWAPSTIMAEDQIGGSLYMGNLPGDGSKTSEASGLNSANRVVGKSMIQNNSVTYHAFRTQPDSFSVQGISFLDDLGVESGIDSHSSEAWDINDSDEVVGGTMTTIGEFQAFLRNSLEGKHIGFTRLGCLPGGNWSIAQAINNKGTIVGRSRVTLTGGAIRAFVYFNNGTLRNLNEMIPPGSGWVLIGAEDINNDGRIVGYGTKNGETRAFLLTPNN
jgi:probable HAF family extracellular repeat protein